MKFNQECVLEASGYRQDPTRKTWSSKQLDQLIIQNGWDKYEDVNQAWEAVINMTGSYELAYAVSDRLEGKHMDESKNIRIRLRDLRKIIFEALEEAERDAPEGATPYHDLEDDSLDVKLDNYFVDSEGGDREDMGESWLREAEDDPPAPAGGEAPPPDDGGDDPAKPDIPEEEMKIDAAGFAREVAHLIENFTNLLDVKGVVLRRALNYVGKKYGKEQSNTVKDVLETQFGVYSDEKEEPQAPGAANAGPALAG